MIALTTEQIEEIAENVDRGMLCFYHIPSGEITSFSSLITDIPNGKNSSFSGKELEDRKLYNRIEKVPDEYISFEVMSSRKTYDAMQAYALSLDHEIIKEYLLQALKKEHPIRSFKEALFSLPHEVCEDWKFFKKQKGREWVEEQIELYDF